MCIRDRAVVEHGGLPGCHAAREDGPAALPAAQKGSRQRADEAADGDGLRPLHAGGDVALGDVGQFVAEHARELGLVVKLHDEPGVDEDGTARHGEGVHAVVQQHVGGEREGPVSYTHLDVYKRQSFPRSCFEKRPSPPFSHEGGGF